MREEAWVCKVHITEVFLLKALIQIQSGKESGNDAEASGRVVIGKQLAGVAANQLSITKNQISDWFLSAAQKALES